MDHDLVVLQARIGVEIPYEHVRFRGGAGILPSVYSNDNKVNGLWSAGIGYRGKSFYCDFAWQTFRYTEGLVPFRTGNSDLNNDGRPDAVESFVRSQLSQQHFLLTLGFRY